LIIADTDVLIDYLAGVPAIKNELMRYIDSDRLWTTAVSCFELLSGAEEGNRGNSVRLLVDSLSVLPLDRAAAQRAANVRRHLDRAGQAIGMADSLIAGIALLHDLPLFTRNRGHFSRVPGLMLVTIPDRD
jgi:tRNA(fMet)-specific endonuclease VapC